MEGPHKRPAPETPGGGTLPADPLEFSPAARARWECSAEEIRRVGREVVDLIAEHLTTLPGRPVFRPYPAARADAMAGTPMPSDGTDASAILAEFAETIEPYPLGNGHPRFYGWVNSPPAVMGVFAEALAAAMNPSCAGGNHAAVHLERQVLRWFAEMLGFPGDAGGLLVSGGSMATVTALAVARHVATAGGVRDRGLARTGSPLVVYTSAEGHGCIRKAVELLGLGAEHLRAIPCDEAYRLRVPDLERAIDADAAAGLRPAAVVATAGTVNTGAIDPLADLAALCRHCGLWFHVDGAYGAPAVLVRDYRDQLAPIALADSVAVDPHKWLYVPVEAGLVLVRNGDAMRGAFSLVPPYLRSAGEVGGPPWFSEFGPQQTRGFRALKVWMALKHHGRRGYAEAIARDIALARHLASLVDASGDLELAAPPSLSIVCFRYAPPPLRADPDLADAVNRAVLEELQLGGAVFLTSTTLGGRFVLRACIVNPRARRADLDLLVDLVRDAGRRALRAAAASG